jgi:hypothetical protein
VRGRGGIEEKAWYSATKIIHNLAFQVSTAEQDYPYHPSFSVSTLCFHLYPDFVYPRIKIEVPVFFFFKRHD